MENEGKATILTIDDDKISQKFLFRAIQNDFNISSAFNGEDGLKLAAELNPDIILLDVEMPGLNGYEVCERLREIETFKETPIVFLSGRGTLRERMLGFEAGGDDYVVKPFIAEDLLAKINVLVKFRDKNLLLKSQISEAEKTAHNAMESSSELGMAIALIEKSMALSTFESLALHFFLLTNRLSLKCSIFVNCNGEMKAFSSRGAISPLEIEILIMLRSQSRFHDFGCRTQINYPNISLLIKNMPLDNMDRYGRIKDLLPLVLATFDSKIQVLNFEHAMQQQNFEMNSAFEGIRETIKDLGTSLQENSRGGQLVLSKMLLDLSNQLPAMALEEDQEEFILNSIESAINTTQLITDAGNNISASFEMVIQQMQNLVTKQNRLVESSTNIERERQSKTIQKEIDSEIGDDGIELF